MTRKIVAIEGMSCGHCIQWISQALEKIDGVDGAKVRIESQNAEIEYDETRVTEKMITEAIEKAGYGVKSFS